MRSMALACLLALAGFAQTAEAQTRQSAQFSLEIKGIPFGQLSFTSSETASSYAVSGKVETTGLAALLRQMKYEASVEGRKTRSGFAPSRYEQKGGSKSYSEETVVWRNGLPKVERENPPRGPRSYAADPARQSGTVDTLTALYATLRDVAPGQECQSSLVLFDGRYRMRLRMSRPERQADGRVLCQGRYIREEGFSPADMAERKEFPFQLTYRAQASGQMAVMEVKMDSLYGAARLVRR